uniref:Uncharacterized protein n=1 Tax=Trichuris muris TaxID=70415 RepID=A0A5S6Q0A9_TRIMR
MRRSVKRPDYAAFWHKPAGPPKVSIVKNIIVQYRPIKGNPPWDGFSSKLIKSLASIQIETDKKTIVKKKVEKEKIEDDQKEADADEEKDEEKHDEDDDKETEGKEDGDDLEDDEKKTVDEE